MDYVQLDGFETMRKILRFKAEKVHFFKCTGEKSLFKINLSQIGLTWRNSISFRSTDKRFCLNIIYYE